jgi:hypothetical protein
MKTLTVLQPWAHAILVKRGQEFIRVRHSLLRTLHRSTMGLKTPNRGPGRRLSGKDRLMPMNAARLLDGSPSAAMR